MRIIAVIFLLGWVFVCPVSGQEEGYTADGGWSYQYYHARNSSVRNSCHRIARDRNGFFWFATQDGLLQFDGRQFVQHATSSIPGFYSGRISGLLAISPDTLMVSSHFTNDNSCLIVNSRLIPDSGNIVRKRYLFNFRSQLLPAAPALMNQVLEAPNWQLNGMIWTHSNPATVYVQYRGKGFRVLHSDGRPASDLAYGTAYPALMRSFTTDSLLYLVRENAPWRATCFRDGNLLGDRPIRFDIPPTGDSLLQVSWSMHSQEMILVFNRSLYHMVITPEGLLATRLCTGLDFSSAIATWYDPERGTLLVGSTHSGLYVMQRMPLQFQASPSGRAVFYNVFDLGNGQVATFSPEGWYLYRPGAPGEPVFIPVEGRIKDPRTAFQDSKGRLWVPVFDKKSKSFQLAVFQPGDLHHFRPVMTVDPYNLFLAEEPDGSFWVVGQQKVFHISPDFAVEQVGFVPPWKQKTIFGVTRAPDGLLWIGAEGGVYRYQPTTNWCDSLPAFSHVSARNIFFDPDGTGWVATYGQGLFHLSGRLATPIPGDRQGYLKFAHSLVTDRQGNCWITTNNGLFMVPREHLLAYVAGKRAAPDYFYVSLNAFPSSEFNGGAPQPLLVMPDSRIVACNVKGLVSFYPADIPVRFPESPVVLLRTQVGGKDQFLAPDADLPPDFGRIAFELATAYNGPTENVQMYYRLAGFETEWKPYAYGEAITYTALPAGMYALETRILRGFGGVYEYRKLLSFCVLPHWYQTWWAVLLYLAAVALLIYALLRWRLNRVNWLNQELNRMVALRTEELEQTVARLHLSEASLRTAMETRDRIISIISHDMKTPLLFMSRVSAELLRYPVRIPDKDLHEYLEQVTATTTELHQWLGSLLSWIRSEGNLSLKPEEVKVGELVREVLDLYRQAATSKGITLESAIPDTCLFTGDRNWLKVMFSNLIENSVKFSNGGVVRVETEIEGERKHIRITDQGRGMTEQRVIAMQREQIAVAGKGTAGERGLGLGLQIVSKIVALHQGTWEIRSVPDQGTCISIWLPQRVSP